MAEEKRSPLDRLLFATFLKGRTSSRDLWDEKGEVTAEDAICALSTQPALLSWNTT